MSQCITWLLFNLLFIYFWNVFNIYYASENASWTKRVVWCVQLTIRQREKPVCYDADALWLSFASLDVLQLRFPSLSCQRNCFGVVREDVTIPWFSCAGGIVNFQAGLAFFYFLQQLLSYITAEVSASCSRSSPSPPSSVPNTLSISTLFVFWKGEVSHEYQQPHILRLHNVTQFEE